MIVFKKCKYVINKIDKGTVFVVGWKSEGVYTSKLTPLYTALLHRIKLSGYRIIIKFDNSVLVVEQKQLCDQNYKCLHL